MKRLNHLAALVLVAVLAVSGCALPSGPEKPLATFDLGPAPVATVSTVRVSDRPRPTLIVGEVVAPSWLDSIHIYYRLAFADVQQPRPYAQSRWTMAPPQLVSQRARLRLARFANIVSAGDTSQGAVVKLELDDFSQMFETQDVSRGVLLLRVSLISNGRVIGQRSFATSRVASSANAAGGVRALTEATDAVLEELSAWLATQLS